MSGARIMVGKLGWREGCEGFVRLESASEDEVEDFREFGSRRTGVLCCERSFCIRTRSWVESRVEGLATRNSGVGFTWITSGLEGFDSVIFLFDNSRFDCEF